MTSCKVKEVEAFENHKAEAFEIPESKAEAEARLSKIYEAKARAEELTPKKPFS